MPLVCTLITHRLRQNVMRTKYMQASSVCVTGLVRGQFTAKVSQNELHSFAAKVRSCQTQQAFGNSIACVASVSVGLSSRWRRFSLFGCAKIGASATLMEAAQVASQLMMTMQNGYFAERLQRVLTFAFAGS